MYEKGYLDDNLVFPVRNIPVTTITEMLPVLSWHGEYEHYELEDRIIEKEKRKLVLHTNCLLLIYPTTRSQNTNNMVPNTIATDAMAALRPAVLIETAPFVLFDPPLLEPLLPDGDEALAETGKAETWVMLPPERRTKLALFKPTKGEAYMQYECQSARHGRQRCGQARKNCR
jgi:hypothetical protein